jgi:pimeloyl-ACP methyl ester carboxylesterase
MKQRLADEGIYAWVINFETDPITHSNEAPIELQAQALSVLINKVLKDTGRPAVSLVCHSMGGLAARYYLEHDRLWPSPKSSQVSRVIMLGTPNWGTDVFLENPVTAVIAARTAGRIGLHNSDTLRTWSTAMRETFAEWQPAPISDGKGGVSYPPGFRLGEWACASGSSDYKSPMNEGKFREANTWKAGRLLTDLHLIVSNAEDRRAVEDAMSMFASASKRDELHREYYTQSAKSLGNLYPKGATAAGWGVSARYVSDFLAELNAPGADRSGARVYLIAGSKADVRIDELKTHIESPYTSLGNDGLIPEDSALGIDPLTGVCVFASVKEQRTLDFNHSDLPHCKPVIDLVVDWLKEG